MRYRKIYLILIVLNLMIGQSRLLAQSNSNEGDTTIYFLVDKFPVLITNDKEYELSEISEFIYLKLKFPEDDFDCQGSVYISFIVEKDGSISNKKYVRKLCSGYDEKAMDLINLMKYWKPGIKSKKLVRTKVVIPIKWSR